MSESRNVVVNVAARDPIVVNLPTGPRGPMGLSFQPDARGTLAARSAYNSAAVDFAYLATDEAALYFRAGAPGGWSGPFYIAGNPGPQGEPGDDGADGADGIDGVDGKSAYQLALDNGFSGSLSAWLLSLKGEQGDDGPPGADGNDGAPGETGATGSRGAGWWEGAGAPSNSLGVVGDFYLNRTNGDYYEKTGASAWTLRGNIKGPQGDQGIQGIQGIQGEPGVDGADGADGADGLDGDAGAPGAPGSIWRSGTGAPSGALGVVGDWYLNDANGDVYEKTGASTYTLRDNITGPQGIQGIQGVQGETGAPGATGSGFDPLTTAVMQDHFSQGELQDNRVGELRWAIVGTPTFVSGESGHVGIYRMTSAASASAAAAYFFRNASFPLMLPSDTFDMYAVVRLSHADANTTYRLGLQSDSTPTYGIYFEKLTTDTNWFGVCKSNSGGNPQTRVDTGVAQGTSWVRLRIRRIDASTIGFSINGGTEVTINTNVPTVAVNPFFRVLTGNAVAKYIDFDLFYLKVAVSL